jgi:hypothetical protein
LTQSVDGDEESTDVGNRDVKVPLVNVLVKKREFVVFDVATRRDRRRTLLRYERVSRPTCVVVLAAGEGTRMRSSRPKPLHHLCGRAMVRYVLDAAAQEDVRATVVVVGHHATWVEKSLSAGRRADVPLTFVEQSEQLGTGHAVSVALADHQRRRSAPATATS